MLRRVHRLVAVAAALAVLLTACSGERGAYEGFRDLDPDEVIKYRVQPLVTQGSDDLSTLPSRVHM